MAGVASATNIKLEHSDDVARNALFNFIENYPPAKTTLRHSRSELRDQT
jgi:hypothetical protein